MFRTLLVAVALSISVPAFACDGETPCNKEHCKMKPQSEVDTAMAAVDAAAGTKIALTVTGMSCGSCSDRVTATLKGITGVNAAAVSHVDGVAKVAFDESKTNVDALIAAVNGLGKFTAAKKVES